MYILAKFNNFFKVLKTYCTIQYFLQYFQYRAGTLRNAATNEPALFTTRSRGMNDWNRFSFQLATTRGRIPYLQYGEVFQHAVHHVLLGQMLQLQNEVDHVLAHRRAVDAVSEAIVLEPGVLGLHVRPAFCELVLLGCR